MGPTPAAWPFVGAAGSRDHKRKRDENLLAAGGPSIGADDASVPVRNNPTTNQDLCLGCTDLATILRRRPIRDPGVTYGLYTLVGMRRNDLLKLLASMDQTVTKKKPTRLELFGAAVTLLFSLHRLSL